jgi:hypothetical protein
MLAHMGTQAEVAVHVGCTDALVGHWMRGDRVPAPHWRDIIAQIYSIPVGVWDLPVSSVLSPAPSLRQRIALALAQWPEARARVDAILRQAGIT